MINKEELKEIMSLLSNSDESAEDMYCEYEGFNYGLKQIDEEGWEDKGKYQSNTIIFALIRNKEKSEDTGIRVAQGLIRTGNYYGDYDYEFGYIEQVEQVEIVTTKWVAVN